MVLLFHSLADVFFFFFFASVTKFYLADVFSVNIKKNIEMADEFEWEAMMKAADENTIADEIKGKDEVSLSSKLYKVYKKKRIPLLIFIGDVNPLLVFF